jgi:hypothetical protein
MKLMRRQMIQVSFPLIPGQLPRAVLIVVVNVHKPTSMQPMINQVSAEMGTRGDWTEDVACLPAIMRGDSHNMTTMTALSATIKVFHTWLEAWNELGSKNLASRRCAAKHSHPVNGQVETPIGWIYRVVRAFCDAVDLLGTSQDRGNQARVGIEPA